MCLLSGLHTRAELRENIKSIIVIAGESNGRPLTPIYNALRNPKTMYDNGLYIYYFAVIVSDVHDYHQTWGSCYVEVLDYSGKNYVVFYTLKNKKNITASSRSVSIINDFLFQNFHETMYIPYFRK